MMILRQVAAGSANLIQRRSAISLTTTSSFLSLARIRRTTSSTTTTTKGALNNDTGGYQSFGSFHSDNVVELIRLPRNQYVAPPLPFDTDDDIIVPPLPKDKATMEYYFTNSYPTLNRKTWTFLNHGAFGLGLHCGLHRAQSWRNYAEKQPLQYFDRTLLPHMVHVTRKMVDFVTTNEVDATILRSSVAMIQNVTSGMNSVIAGHYRHTTRQLDRHHYHYQNKGVGCASASTISGQQVFYYDITYGSTKKISKYHHGQSGNAIEIPFEEEYLPKLQQINNTEKEYSDYDDDDNAGDTNNDVANLFIMALDKSIEKYCQHMRSTTNITSSMDSNVDIVKGSLLILDHITSNTAIHVPITAIAKHAKEVYGMIIVVDGAHGLLSLPLNMGTLLSSETSSASSEESNNKQQQQQSGYGGYIDIYITNCHKWLSSPRGAAYMFCANSTIQSTILAQPAVISHGVDDGFLSRYMWDGCRDYSAQLAVSAVLDYWNSLDLPAIRTGIRINLIEGVLILCSYWHPNGIYYNSSSLTLVPIHLSAPTMTLVRLPDTISGNNNSRKTSTDAKRIQDYLYQNNIEVPIKCIRGVLYVRISCHVYNTSDDFDRLGQILMKYCNPT